MLVKNKKRKLTLTLVLSILASGIIISLFFILPNLLDVSHYRANNDFTIEYNEGYSGVNIDFRMSHRIADSFDILFIYQTICSDDVEEIGITDITYDIFRDEDLIWFDDLDFNEPLTYGYDSYVIQNIGLYNNISFVGTVTAQFNVEGILHEEKFDFILNIIIPINPYEIRNAHLINSIWIYSGLGFGLLVLIIIIYRTGNAWKHDKRYTGEEINKDREFFGYISSKVKENKKNSS